jgi:hypothetical protein
LVQEVARHAAVSPRIVDQKMTASHTRAGNERRLFPPEQSSKTSTLLNEVSANSNKFSSAWPGVIAIALKICRPLMDDEFIAACLFASPETSLCKATQFSGTSVELFSRLKVNRYQAKPAVLLGLSRVPIPE